MANDEYEHELTASREEIATALHDVADGVRSGAVRLGTDADAVTVATPDELTLDVELETEDGERSLDLELEWPESEVDDASVEPPSAAESSASEPAESWTDESPPVDETETPAVAEAADATQSLARFEVYSDAAGEWRWRLRHRNGNVIATGGEGYTQKHNALKGLRSVMQNSPDAAVTEEFSD
ncbi:amphi-Trp domain-containing protein [Haloparvum sedimenti]|uniref:amphi-Trp domain-containing protein n=1 Tax=Haloparvum sedimenti TaxID=1678448 RepID=UPI00071E91BD|nr:amphi-Trp domain-containing protein [Haloparvum sedimenti]